MIVTADFSRPLLARLLVALALAVVLGAQFAVLYLRSSKASVVYKGRWLTGLTAVAGGLLVYLVLHVVAQ